MSNIKIYAIVFIIGAAIGGVSTFGLKKEKVITQIQTVTVEKIVTVEAKHKNEIVTIDQKPNGEKITTKTINTDDQINTNTDVNSKTDTLTKTETAPAQSKFGINIVYNPLAINPINSLSVDYQLVHLFGVSLSAGPQYSIQDHSFGLAIRIQWYIPCMDQENRLAKIQNQIEALKIKSDLLADALERLYEVEQSFFDQLTETESEIKRLENLKLNPDREGMN